MNSESQRNIEYIKVLPLEFDSSTVGNHLEIVDDAAAERFELDTMRGFRFSSTDYHKYSREITARGFVALLIERGWLTIELMQKVVEDDKNELYDFLINLAMLSHEVEQAKLSDEEIGAIKKNVGTISIEVLREGVREKIEHGA